MASGWSGERPDQSVDQSAHLLDQVQICRKIPLRKVAESDRTQSDCETIGILEDEDDDEHEDDSSNSVFRFSRQSGPSVVATHLSQTSLVEGSSLRFPTTFSQPRTAVVGERTE